MVDCPACGEPNPGRARFCLACGEPLPAPTARPGGSRRAVTVVFSDLSGSTALGETSIPRTPGAWSPSGGHRQPVPPGLGRPEFQVRLNETRMQFTNQVTGVLMEAYGEAGQDLVDPELVAALAEALASAAGDPRPWRDG
jgi:Double zinc ribbon